MAYGSALAAEPDFESSYYAIGLSRNAPAFSWFALDSLGRGKVQVNPVLDGGSTNATVRFEAKGARRFCLPVEACSRQCSAGLGDSLRGGQAHVAFAVLG